MGDDADFFVSEGDGNLASVQDAGDDDLLGGGGSNFPALDGSKDELSGFESSFPAIDTTNEVRAIIKPIHGSRDAMAAEGLTKH